MQENTPDFIFTHFIELFCDATAGAPMGWKLQSTVIAIQQTTLRVVLKIERWEPSKKNPAMQLQSFNNY